VATPQQPHGDTQDAEPETLSAFIARILNQLSLSAWLPGAFLIAGLILLVWFQRSGTVTFAGLGNYIQDNWIPVLLLALPSLVIATLLTQAFAFEAIRALEGYWSGSGPLVGLSNLCVERQLRRKDSLAARLQDAKAAAFESARTRMLARGVDAGVVLAAESDCRQSQRPPRLSEAQHVEADKLRWWDECDPWLTARWVRLRRDLADYPADSRILPTKLGNVLRATEDGLSTQKGGLENFVMSHREAASARVIQHHDQFRTRLDMYCTMVFVAVVLALASVPLLWNLAPLERAGVALGLVLVCWASYAAAVSSAAGYTAALSQIDASVRSQIGSPTPHASAAS
jgi:hypothetical protein